MGRKYFTLLLLCLFFQGYVSAQSRFISADGLAFFYPAKFDSTQHFPSFVLQSEPVVFDKLSAAWRLSPVFTLEDNKSKATLNCGAADFYGTGEVVGKLKRNNTHITLWNTDNYGYESFEGKRLYQSHPWVMGVRADGSAFGVIADNTWRMDIAISDNSVEFTSDGPAFRVLIFEAVSPQKAVEKLAEITGKMDLPPIWSLGYQQCRYSYMNEAEVKALADNFRAKQLPCDVLWMDIDYMDQYKIFTFSSNAFPNPHAVNDYLHHYKFKSVWMIDPGVKQEEGYSVYDQGSATPGKHWVQNSSGENFVGNVWPGPCVFPDYTRPETRKWWGDLYHDFMSTGIDGVWNDMNEPSVFKGGEEGTMLSDNMHRGGGLLPAGSHLRYHNVYGRLMVQASREGILRANPKKRPFILSRSNFLGGQKYAATWTGDNQATMEHLKLSVPMVLTLGLSGQTICGPDVGGFKGDCNPKLLGHWMALGVFYPFYRNHSDKASVRQEPWSFGKEIEASSRTSLQRRYRLLPYLYSLAQESSINGLPMMRPLFFADPTDAKLRDQEEAFLLGDILMVVPKWASGVHMPKGKWILLSIVGEDSKNDTYQANVFLKSGSILPLGQIVQSSVDYSADSLTLLVSLDASETAIGTLYSDEGDGFAYQNGAYLLREFTMKALNKEELVFNAEVKGGNLSTAKNKYRIAIVGDSGVVYSAWSSIPRIVMPKPR